MDPNIAALHDLLAALTGAIEDERPIEEIKGYGMDLARETLELVSAMEVNAQAADVGRG